MLRQDDLGNGYRIWQDTTQFCFGIDAVLLAHYGHPAEGGRALDLGCGNGIIPLLLAADLKKAGITAQLTGLEIQAEAAALAERSVRENGLTDTITIVRGDLREASSLFKRDSFSYITCNPPYFAAGTGLQSSAPARAIARQEICCTLEDVVREASGLLKMSGHLAMVYRPFRMAGLFILLGKYGLEPKRMRLVCPHPDEAPSLFLIEAVRGGKPGLTVEAPLIVRDAAGRYTDELLAIYGMKDVKEEP